MSELSVVSSSFTYDSMANHVPCPLDFQVSSGVGCISYFRRDLFQPRVEPVIQVVTNLAI